MPPKGPIVLSAYDGAVLACWDLVGPDVGDEQLGIQKCGKSAPERHQSWERRGDRLPLLMVHGTGLNGRSWAPVAAILAGAGFTPLALDLRGHGASGRSPTGDYPWSLFAQDILAVVDELGLEAGAGGALGVGHSAGASALLLAESARPGTFSKLWAWEPIMSTPGSDLRQLRGPQLAEQARRRRAHFPSAEEAKPHLRGRGMFAEFSPAALDAFSSGAFVADDGGGVRLACLPEDEARIYEAAGAQGTWDQLALVKCPVRVVGGELSPAVPPAELSRIAGQLPRGEEAVAAGLAHFGPFQDPSVVAADIALWAGGTG